jgi:hypothetical protein
MLLRKKEEIDVNIKLDYDYRYFDNPGGEFIIYGDNYKEIFDKINPEFRPRYIVTSSIYGGGVEVA